MYRTVFRDDEIFLGAAFRSGAAFHLKILADVVLASEAGCAVTADEMGAGGRLHTRVEVFDSRAYADDLAAVFMALDHGIGIGEGVLAVIHVNVRTADADAVDLQQEFVGLELARRRNVAEDDVIGFC
jgi:hypothetical protein